MKIWGVAAALALLTGPSAVGGYRVMQDPHVEFVDQSGVYSLPTYETLNEAALATAVRLYKCSHYYECYAVIAQRPDGKFVGGYAYSDYNGAQVMDRYGV